MKKFLWAMMLCFPILGQLYSQNSKPSLDEQAYFEWKSIDAPKISRSGDWVCYEINPGFGDGRLAIYNAQSGQSKFIDRGFSAEFDFDGSFLAFKIKPPKYRLDSLNRLKVQEDDLPSDTLGILDLQNWTLTKIAPFSAFTLPGKWGGSIFYEVFAKNDSIPLEEGPRKSKNDEYLLVHLNYRTDQRDTFRYVTNYEIAKEVPTILVASRSPDSLAQTVVTWKDMESGESEILMHEKGEIAQLRISFTGDNCAFIGNFDTIQNVQNRNLYYWSEALDSMHSVHDSKAEFLPNGWIISDDQELTFSKKGTRLFFGTKPQPAEKDTTLLPDEFAEVEVWNYLDGSLYTQQKVKLVEDMKSAYTNILFFDESRVQPLGHEKIPDLLFNEDRNTDYALGTFDKPYLPLLSWEGRRYFDLHAINVTTGEDQLIKRKTSGRPRVSPGGKYAYWYDEVDSSYYIYQFANHKLVSYKGTPSASYYDELNDQPDFPSAYGVMGWIESDRALLVYDRYDIWRLDPTNISDPIRITNGRLQRRTHRYIKLDTEQQFINGDVIYLHVFDEDSKEESYLKLFLDTGKEQIIYTGKKLQKNPQKAAIGDEFLFTEESFEIFPDLVISYDENFTDVKKISAVNPQQANYHWGTIEEFTWQDFDGIERKGLLTKPENFSPSKKYPLIVNFYERSSNSLHRHRPPVPGRSTIGYAFYVSNGYVIFNPDIHYKIGQPGQSAFDAVVSGTKALIKEGLIDSTRMGLQGHSWGGYQIADIITKTDMFRCAEAGAPVVNMISAYGGIRWGTGLSRMFQYEHTQSRLGSTLWDDPQLYVNNSPIFQLHKVSTPVLILHNDGDGHVPWYQGIEFFVGLRRLGKPAWFLNYNGEPHWPLKWANRLDFNKRMFQFFNHYLKDEPMPKWMSQGIPAIKKGIEYGFEEETFR